MLFGRDNTSVGAGSSGGLDLCVVFRWPRPKVALGKQPAAIDFDHVVDVVPQAARRDDSVLVYAVRRKVELRVCPLAVAIDDHVGHPVLDAGWLWRRDALSKRNQLGAASGVVALALEDSVRCKTAANASPSPVSSAQQ